VEDAEYEMATQQLKKGDVLVAYTDGVIEVNNPQNQEYGRDSLINLVKANTSLSAEELTEKIYREIENFSKGKKYNDDFTLIVLKAKSD
jgi:sigma-B regulation protein RsbU (phosphoserine phosphatase)